MKTFHILAACSLLISTPAFAQVDGTLGSESSGSLDVSLSVAPAPEAEIQITGLENIDFGEFTDGESLPGTQSISNICVQGSNALTYSIRLSSLNDLDNTSGGRLVSDLGSEAVATYTAVYTNFDGLSQDSGLALASGLGESCASDELSTLELTLVEISGVESLSEQENLTDTLTLEVSTD